MPALPCFAAGFTDHRNPDRVGHFVRDLVSQWSISNADADFMYPDPSSEAT